MHLGTPHADLEAGRAWAAHCKNTKEQTNALEVTKPYKFIGFGALDATKPYKFIGFGPARPHRTHAASVGAPASAAEVRAPQLIWRLVLEDTPWRQLYPPLGSGPPKPLLINPYFGFLQFLFFL